MQQQNNKYTHCMPHIAYTGAYTYPPNKTLNDKVFQIVQKSQPKFALQWQLCFDGFYNIVPGKIFASWKSFYFFGIYPSSVMFISAKFGFVQITYFFFLVFFLFYLLCKCSLFRWYKFIYIQNHIYIYSYCHTIACERVSFQLLYE